MTDEELIKRLRDACRGGDECKCSLSEAAARIAALTATVAGQSRDIETLLTDRNVQGRRADAAEAENSRLRAMLTPPDDLRTYTVDYISGGADHGLPGDMPLVPADVVATLRARLARMEGALTQIAEEASVPVHTWKNGINFKKMYEGWRKIATKRIDVARAALTDGGKHD